MALALDIMGESPNLRKQLTLFRYTDITLPLDGNYFLVIRNSKYTLIMLDPLQLIEEYKKYYDGYHVISKDGAIEFGVCKDDMCVPKGWVTDTNQYLFGAIERVEDYSDWVAVIPEFLKGSNKFAACSPTGDGGLAICQLRSMTLLGTTNKPALLSFSERAKGIYNIVAEFLFPKTITPV